MRFVYDKISVHVRGLEALGVDASRYGSLLIPVIMAKLPQDVRVQIARNTKQDIWEIGELLDVIQREVEARERSDNVKVTSDNRKPPAPPVLPQDKLPPSANTLMALGSGSTPVNKGLQCVYCAGSHYSASCDRVTDVNTRKESSSETGDALCVYEGVIEMINANNTKVVANVKVSIINQSVRGHFNLWDLLLKYTLTRISWWSHDAPTKSVPN